MGAPEHSQLEGVVASVDSEPPPATLRILVEDLVSRGAGSVAAVVFYGSCRRAGNLGEGIADLYLLVDTYSAYYGRWPRALAAHVLRPTVEYRELETSWGVARAKCAVLTLADFEAGASGGWFHSYLWGRFAQPAPVVYARDEQVRARTVTARAAAVETLLARSQPLWPGRFHPFQAWCRALRLSYGAELRAEGPLRIRRIYRADRAYYDRALAAARDRLPWSVEHDEQGSTEAVRYRQGPPDGARGHCRRSWAIRRIQGRVLTLLRLTKGAFTFRGGTDYLLWKIARHTGRRVHPHPWQRRHPLLAAPWLIWKLIRQGGQDPSRSGRS